MLHVAYIILSVCLSIRVYQLDSYHCHLCPQTVLNVIAALCTDGIDICHGGVAVGSRWGCVRMCVCVCSPLYTSCMVFGSLFISTNHLSGVACERVYRVQISGAAVIIAACFVYPATVYVLCSAVP